MEQKKVWLKYVTLFSLFVVALVPMTSAALTDNALRLGLFIMFLGLYWQQYKVKKLENNNFFNKYLLFFVLYGLVMLISALLNPNLVKGVKMAWQRIFEISPFFILLISNIDKKKLWQILAVFLLGMLIANFYYIGQFYFHGGFMKGIGSYRPTAFYWENWFMQTFLIFTVTVCVVLLDFLKDTINKWSRFFLYVLTILSLVSAILSDGRAVWLTLAVFFATYSFLRLYKKNIKKLIALSVIFILGIFFLYNISGSFKHRTNQIFDMQFSSNANRVWVWKSSWNMFLDNPLFGVGQANWEEEYLSKYIYPAEFEKLPNAHSAYLQVLSDSGVLGLGTYMLLMLYVAFWGFNNFRKKNLAPEQKAGCLIMFFLTLNFFVFGTMGDVRGTRTLVETLWFLMGISYLLVVLYEKEKDI